MKKKFLAASLVLMMGAFSLTGCGGNSNNYEDYVTLGDYIGLAVEKPDSQVTEAEIKEMRDDELSYYVEYEAYDGPASTGDMVELSMTAKAGGDIVYDFTGEEETYEITIGDAEFGKDFDYNITGNMVGAKLSFEIQYDDSELDDNLANKLVQYDVEIVAISKTIYPEITEEFIKENTEYDSIAEWEAYIEKSAKENHEYENEAAFKENLGKAVVGCCTITGCPDELYQNTLKSYEAEYENYAQMFGTTVEEIYEAFEVTHEEVEQMARENCYQQMALELIAKKEGITITDSDYEAMIEEFTYNEGYETRDDVLGDYTEDALKSMFLQDKTLDFLADRAIITLVKE